MQLLQSLQPEHPLQYQQGLNFHSSLPHKLQSLEQQQQLHFQ